MSDLRSNLIRVASTLPAGDPGRSEILHVIREHDVRLAFDKAAASKLPTVLVQGYDGFTDQIRALSEADSEVKRLEAEIEALAGDLTKKLKDAEKGYKEAVESIRDAYKENLASQGNVIIERKTKLVEAQAKLKVVGVKGTLNAVQTDMLAAVTEKYGAEVAAFIKATQDALQEQHSTMRISMEGFILEARESASKTASDKTAFNIVSVLAKFRDYIKKGWSKIVEVAKAATDVITGRSKNVEKAHTEFMKVVTSV